MPTFEDPGELSPQDWPGAPQKLFEYINRTLKRMRDFLRTRLSLSSNIDCDVRTVRCSHGVEVRVPTRLTAVRGMLVISASKGQQVEYARLVADGANARVTVFFAAGAGTVADVAFVFWPEGSGDGTGLAYTACLRRGMFFSGNSQGTVAAGATIFLGVGVAGAELNVFMVVARATTISRIRIEVANAPGAGQTFTYTVRQNTADSAMTATISGAASFAADITSPTLKLAQFDNWCLKLVTSAGAAVTQHRFAVQFDE